MDAALVGAVDGGTCHECLHDREKRCEKIDLPNPMVREWRIYGIGGIFFGDSF